MHIKRKRRQNQVCRENILKKNLTSFVERNTECLKTRTLCNDDTWTRIKHSVASVFCKHKSEKQVPYASLTRLNRLSISEDELKRVHKKLGFCLKQTEHMSCNNERENEEDDELDCCFDAVLRERVQRCRSFSTRRMAICKEIEKSIKGDRNTSLLELRKTLVMNSRFKEMGL